MMKKLLLQVDEDILVEAQINDSSGDDNIVATADRHKKMPSSQIHNSREVSVTSSSMSTNE